MNSETASMDDQSQSGYGGQMLQNMERDARAMGWLMTGQLIQVTICDGYEQKFLDTQSDTSTATENFTTTEDDVSDYSDYQPMYNRNQGKYCTTQKFMRKFKLLS